MHLAPCPFFCVSLSPEVQLFCESTKMACLDTVTGTYNNTSEADHNGHYPDPAPMTPRLSFSNGFVQSHQDHKTPPNISPSHDFQFSPLLTNSPNQTMTAADELFFKGKLLPTLRDELLLDHDDDGAGAVSSFVPPKGLPKWKETFLSLKRSVDGRCTVNNNNNQGKMLNLALDD